MTNIYSRYVWMYITSNYGMLHIPSILLGELFIACINITSSRENLNNEISFHNEIISAATFDVIQGKGVDI